MKNKKLVMGLAALLAVLIATFAGIYFLNPPQTEKGTKNIEVTVIFADKTDKQFKINTEAEYLADALLQEKIIDKKAQDGMYTVIAGERADYNLDKSWWCLTKNGEMVNVGINDQPIADGDKYEITNTPS